MTVSCAIDLVEGVKDLRQTRLIDVLPILLGEIGHECGAAAQCANQTLECISTARKGIVGVDAAAGATLRRTTTTTTSAVFFKAVVIVASQVSGGFRE